MVRDIEAAGGKALAIRADSADVEAVKHAIAETADVLGRLDILVNNAGVTAMAPIDRFSIEEFDRLAAISEVAGMVSYLASPEAALVTGASLRIDASFTTRTRLNQICTP